MSEEYLLSAYLAGLRMDTQMHVRMFNPQSTRQCLVLGSLYEKAHPKREVKSGWSGSKPSTSTYAQKPSLGTQKEEGTKPKEASGKLRPFVSQAEMSERRAKGLCYYCDEKFTPEHFQKHKKTQLYSMECDDEGEDSDEEGDIEENSEGRGKEVAQISINAISGVSDYTTMKVRGHMARKTFMC